MERAATTASSLEAEQDSGNIIRTQSMATLNEPIPKGTSSGSGPRRQNTILGDRPAQTKFERLSKQSNEPPLSRVTHLEVGRTDAQALDIKNLKTRVKKLERKKKSRTPQVKRRLFKVKIKSSAEKSLEDAETQGRYGHDVTTAEPITTASAPITATGVSVSTTEPNTPPPTTTTLIEDEDLIIALTLMKMRSEILETDIQEKDKNKAKSDKTEHENEKSVKRSQSQSQSQPRQSQNQ
ncbi:hypothetical protein Tco_1055575 [Tanacetum coccineum]|uniref:Uncharacterized protein n=1 Tax=Tanacetum coccineum TaxID=301880 RepID=A0ABQ5H2E0_9ASTR